MKTPEEWSDDFWQRDFNGPPPAVHDYLKHLFKEIQDDAYLAGELAGIQKGMTEAADIAGYTFEINNEESYKTACKSKQLILTSRDAKALAAKEGK